MVTPGLFKEIMIDLHILQFDFLTVKMLQPIYCFFKFPNYILLILSGCEQKE